ncbi:dioxygenase [Acidithiobacillus sp. YTS05]|nr:dioxygenase [Acidithiobacillus sp. YTS05]
MDWDPPDTWSQLRNFLSTLPNRLPQRPRAILVVSAHWEEKVFTVQSNPHPSLLYDYLGFPEHTYHLSWPAPGDPELAETVVDLLGAAGIPTAKDHARGYDHGVFVPLMLLFPAADIPCVQLSLQSSLDPGLHFSAGEALTSLREDNVLIIGSGNSFHNVRVMMSPAQNRQSQQLGLEFDDWLTKTIASSTSEEVRERLSNWYKAPGAKFSHPREEHLAPLFVVTGAARESLGEKIFEDHAMDVVESVFLFGDE